MIGEVKDNMRKIENKEWIFKCSFFMAFVTHCALFFGGAMSVNEDNFTIYREGYTNAALGRWVCDVLYKLGIPGPYRAQSWIGIFVVLALAVVCTVVLSMIKVTNKISALLIMEILVAFPTLAYSYGYLYDAVLYTFSLMFASLAVWMANRWKHGWMGGALCLMFSLGLYQAWIAFAVTLVIVYIVVEIKEDNYNRNQMIALIFRNVFMGIGGLSIYLLSVRVYNAVYNITLSSYKGLDSMGNISLTNLPRLIINCYVSFGKFVFGIFYHMPKPIIVLNYIIIILLFLMSMHVIIKKMRTKKYLEAGLFFAFLAILPIGMCLMEIVANTDTLSIYAICLLYVLLIKWVDDWLENPEEGAVRNRKVICKGIYIVSAIMVTFFFFVTQIYYFKLHVFYQRTYAMANRVVMRIEELEEYPQVRKVLIGGTPINRQDYGTAEVMFDDVIINDRGLWGQYVGMSASGMSDYSLVKFNHFMNGFLGTNFESIKADEAVERLKTDEYAKMPLWPNKGSVQVIDDVIVVKMDEYRWIDINKNNQTHEFRLQSGDEGKMYYVWQLFKDEKEISNYVGKDRTFEADLDEVGSYYARVYIKNEETGKTLASVVSEDIVIN